MSFGIGLGIGMGKVVRGNGSTPLVANFLTGTALPSWLSFSRAGNAMMYDATGKLTYAPANLLLQSNNFSDVFWSKTNATLTTGIDDPFGGLTATRVTAGATNALVSKSNISTAGTPVLNSLYIRRVSGTGAVSMIFPTGGPQPMSLTTSWQRFNNTVQKTGTSVAQFGIIMAVSGDVVDIAFAQQEPVTYQTTPSAYMPTGAAAYYGPRFDYDPTTLQPKGLLLEGTATNVVLWNRDLTNAAWAKTNVTAALDQTGIDGVANSASSLTATAAAATALQSITLASSARAQSAFIKRLVGTGAVQMTTDGGTTWTTLTLTSSWARYSIPAQTLANPQVGFQLAASGDKIAIDFVQNEATSASSPIATVGAAVTRAADVATPALTKLTGPAASVFAEYQSEAAPSSNPILAAQSSIAPLVMGSDGTAQTIDPPAGISLSATAGNSEAWTTVARAGVAFDGAGRSLVMGGGTVAKSGLAGTALTSLQVGSNGWLRSMAIYSRRLSDTQLQAQSIVGAPYQ